MSAPSLAVEIATDTQVADRTLRVIVAGVFMLFFQAYMVAPLIPSLADALHVTRERVGLLIPAYTIPYAVAALVIGPLGDRHGRRGLLFAALASAPLASLALAAAPNFAWLIALRMLSGVTNVSVVVTGLSLVSDLFPPGRRAHALGWVFGAIAGGGAFGSTLGGMLAPWIGCRGLFVLVAAAGLVVFIYALPLWRTLAEPTAVTPHDRRSGVASIAAGYWSLFRTPRGRRTYPFIFMNAVFHSGVFTWLGVLLHDRFGLGEMGIGLALLGYGIPGLFLGPTIGRIVDRHGRSRIIPAGLFLAATTALLLAPSWPLAIAAVAITILSLGFDMTHPLFAGIVSTLDDRRRGQAMGLNAFSIFFGLGVGSLLFGWLTRFGMPTALLTFATMQATMGLIALVAFKDE